MSLLDAWNNTAPTKKTVPKSLSTAFSNDVPTGGLVDPSPLHVACATNLNKTITTWVPSSDGCGDIVPALGALVLVRAQTLPAENGVYVAGPAPIARYGRLDNAAELAKFPVVIVDAGTEDGLLMAGKHYQLTGDAPFTPDTSHLHWTDVTAEKMSA